MIATYDLYLGCANAHLEAFVAAGRDTAMGNSGNANVEDTRWRRDRVSQALAAAHETCLTCGQPLDRLFAIPYRRP